MTHINLLPWRAERRKQREREFFMQLGAAFAAAVLVVILWAFWMGTRIDTQNGRNTYLQGEIKQLDAKIDKIKDLEKVRQRLLARKDIIEQLQANRSQMVHFVRRTGEDHSGQRAADLAQAERRFDFPRRRGAVQCQRGRIHAQHRGVAMVGPG